MTQLASLAALALALLLTACQVTPDQDRAQAIFAAANAVFEEEQLVGLQAAVFSGGRVIDRLNLGFADLEHGVDVSDATRFEVASVNKTFTGLALLQLEEAGGIDLDLPIQYYVPQFPVKPGGPVTPRLLAGGLGGVRHYTEEERTPEYYAAHYDDVLQAVSYFADDPLVATPGDTEVYSSYGYVLLAAAIQQATGSRYQYHITETLLARLGLENTGFVDVRFPLPHRSRHYSFIDLYTREAGEQLQVLPTRDHSVINGGGNMYSTASDLATFGGQFLRPGFLSEAVLEQVYLPHFAADGTPTQFSDGWVLIGAGLSPRFLFFGGSYPGTTAFLAVYPDADLAVAIVTNTWGRNGSNWTLPMLSTLGGILTSQ
ncbi:MAG: serine hydrolase domain-containing protein [Gammaproteobacteria bacterium]|jgi:CubicO group peptidase (beta-lactamase class C family)